MDEILEYINIVLVGYVFVYSDLFIYGFDFNFFNCCCSVLIFWYCVVDVCVYLGWSEKGVWVVG